MKSISLAKALTLGCLVLVALPVACGDDETNPKNTGGTNSAGEPGVAGDTGNPGEGGSGGAGTPPIMIPGTSDMSKTVECGGDMCASISTVSPMLFVDPCCTADDACGVSTEFLTVLGAQVTEVCQPKGQEGPADTACPDSDPQMVPVGTATYPVPGFKGCCRAATGTCGVVVNDIMAGPITFAKFGLGCIDSEPFFGEPGGPCGDAGGSGAGGAEPGPGGTGGAGGAP